MMTRVVSSIVVWFVSLSVGAVEIAPFLSGLSSPLFLTQAPDATGRFFVVERGGAIKVVQPGSTTPTVFLNIGSRIIVGGEQGLLGLAFHPDYGDNGRFFVNYTRVSDGATVIAEYRVSDTDQNLGNPSSERILLSFAQPFSNHNGGMLAFSPLDHFLYIGSGDGGSANDPGAHAQNIHTPLGKILRIDVDPANTNLPYASPPDNPYAGPTAGLDEIFAIGMRNPWRFSFDRVTGALYVADVGQGAREEVSIVTRGGNYGWRVFEGSLCTGLDPALCQNPGNYIFPVTEYAHAGGRCSITGGYVYRGNLGTFPQGTYVYGDFCTGEIFLWNGASQTVLLDTSLSISSFGEDAAGEIYVVNFGGTVHKLVPTTTSCSYQIAPTSQSFPHTGGGGSITVTADTGCQWTAVSRAKWITITAGTAGNGNGSVTYSVGRNQGRKARQGTIDVAGIPFVVNQSGR